MHKRLYKHVMHSDFNHTVEVREKYFFKNKIEYFLPVGAMMQFQIGRIIFFHIQTCIPKESPQ